MKGFTLIELLVALGVFIVLAVFITQSLSSILRLRSKSEVSRLVRQESDYAMSTINRYLRGALSITCSSGGVTYYDVDGVSGEFGCRSQDDDFYIASGSAGLRLTSPAVKVDRCAFSCSEDGGTISISFTVSQSQAASDIRDSASQSVSSQIQLRNR